MCCMLVCCLFLRWKTARVAVLLFQLRGGVGWGGVGWGGVGWGGVGIITNVSAATLLQ